MDIQTFINEKIKPRIQADGGDIRVLSFESDVLSLSLEGECSKCAIAPKYLKNWIIDEIKKQFGVAPKIEMKYNKPYFWNN